MLKNAVEIAWGTLTTISKALW